LECLRFESCPEINKEKKISQMRHTKISHAVFAELCSGPEFVQDKCWEIQKKIGSFFKKVSGIKAEVRWSIGKAMVKNPPGRVTRGMLNSTCKVKLEKF